MRERLATVLALFLGLGVLAWAAWRERQAPPAEPQQVVWRMIDAARGRDVEAYLRCFGGELERRLRGSAVEMGDERFAEYLGESSAELKGVALFDVVEDGERADLVVEFVYSSETERQPLALRRRGDDWTIVDAATGTRRRSLIPHGMPIEELD